MTGTNFNDLWQSQKAVVADPREVIAKAEKVRNNVKRKIIFGNALLLVTLVFILAIVGFYQPKMLTTKIGTLLVAVGIVMQIIASGNMIPIIRKGNTSLNSTDYLKQMLLVKKKQAFLQTTILSLYFIFLSVGIFLYMYEYTLKMSFGGIVLTYGITGLWFAFSWLYLRPRTIRKQQQQLNEIIASLEQMQRQISEENIA